MFAGAGLSRSCTFASFELIDAPGVFATIAAAPGPDNASCGTEG
jgi:hypothetical protein